MDGCSGNCSKGCSYIGLHTNDSYSKSSLVVSSCVGKGGNGHCSWISHNWNSGLYSQLKKMKLDGSYKGLEVRGSSVENGPHSENFDFDID